MGCAVAKPAIMGQKDAWIKRLWSLRSRIRGAVVMPPLRAFTSPGNPDSPPAKHCCKYKHEQDVHESFSFGEHGAGQEACYASNYQNRNAAHRRPGSTSVETIVTAPITDAAASVCAKRP